MQSYNGSLVLRNTGIDPLTSRKDLNAGINKNITVRLASIPPGQGGLADIYDINESQIANPLKSDTNGNYFFKVDDGFYDIISNEGTADEQIDKGVNIYSGSSNSTFIKYPIVISQGQSVINAPQSFQSSILFIDGNMQFETSGAYTQDTTNQTITLSESLQGNEVVELWLLDAIVAPASLNKTFAGLIDTPATYDLSSGYGLRVNQNEDALEFYQIRGTQANPYEFDTCYDFVNNLPYSYLSNGDWVRVNGELSEKDGGQTLYQVTDTPPAARRKYDTYIPVNGDGADIGVTLWAVLKEGFRKDLQNQPIEIIAHRGFNDLGVGNVASTYSAALNYPCDAFEVDWQITSDGVGVLFHDLTLDEDTNGTGAIKDVTYDYIKNLTFNELGGGFWSDKIRISKVEELFALASEANKYVYIEVKDYRQISDIQFLLDVVAAYNWEHNTTIASFNIEDLVETRARNKIVGVGWITTNINTAQENINFDILQKLKKADVLCVDNIMVSFPAVQQKAYDAGINVAGWGLQYTLDVQRIMGVNVPRLIIDNPSLPILKKGC